MCCEKGDFFKIEKQNPKYLTDLSTDKGKLVNIFEKRAENRNKNRLLNTGFPIKKEEFALVKDLYDFGNGLTLEHLEKYFQRSQTGIRKGILKYHNWEERIHTVNKSNKAGKSKLSGNSKSKIKNPKEYNKPIEYTKHPEHNLIKKQYLNGKSWMCLSKIYNRSKGDIQKDIFPNIVCKSESHVTFLGKRLKSQEFCKRCGKPTKKSGYLFKCTNIKCQIVFWDHTMKTKTLPQLRKMSEKSRNAALDDILKTSGVPIHSNKKQQKEGYVYFIYLTKKPTVKTDIPYCYYVGETGKHPYHRYLEHLIGGAYISNPLGGKLKMRVRAHYLMRYNIEPMSKSTSKLKEKELTLTLGCPAYSN